MSPFFLTWFISASRVSWRPGALFSRAASGGPVQQLLFVCANTDTLLPSASQAGGGRRWQWWSSRERSRALRYIYRSRAHSQRRAISAPGPSAPHRLPNCEQHRLNGPLLSEHLDGIITTANVCVRVTELEAVFSSRRALICPQVVTCRRGAGGGAPLCSRRRYVIIHAACQPGQYRRRDYPGIMAARALAVGRWTCIVAGHVPGAPAASPSMHLRR